MENKENIDSGAIASESTAVQGTVESENPNNVVAVETQSSSDANGTVVGVAKGEKKSTGGEKKEKKDFTPKYAKDAEEKLLIITTVFEEETERILDEKDFAATPFLNGTNAILDINTAVANGVTLLTPKVNRTHGKDESTTGESIMTQGAQHPLIVVTKKTAEAAGIKPVRFANDPDRDKPIPEDAKSLVALDGNGRINYLLTMELSDWPQLNAVLPSKNRAGFIDLPACITCINTDIVKWKTQDFVQKRILDEGENTHEGWTVINNLVNHGFKYQAACQMTTLGTDRVLKTAVCKGDTKDVFMHYESAKRIQAVLLEKFVKDLTPLKTKELSKEIATQWKLLQKKYGDEVATDHYVNFLNETLTDEFVKKIQEAKSDDSDKGKVSKDEIRKKQMRTAFDRFVGKQGFDIAMC